MPNFWITLPKPFLALAPMEGITNFVFREMIAEIAKPEVLFTEFTNTDGLFSPGRERVMGNLSFSEKQRPIVAQIWGTDSNNFYKASQLVKQLGFDGIDLNMGCPDKSVVNKKAGAALINDPNLARELIAAAREGAGSLPISVKTRIGFSKNVTAEWVAFLLKQNIDALTIHGRLAKDRFKNAASWENIAAAVEIRNKIAPNTIIVGNGDVKNYQQALEKHQRYQVDGVMLGRAILTNPWLFEKTAASTIHTKEERLALLAKHIRMYRDKWGPAGNFSPIKKFIKMYVNNFPGAASLRDRLMQCRDLTQAEQALTMTA